MQLPLGAQGFLFQDTSMSTMAENSSNFIIPGVKPLQIGDVVVDPPILQAPMAGFTNYAFRQIVREYGGTGLQATEMVNARGFAWLDEHDAEHPDRLWGVRDEPRPWRSRFGTTNPKFWRKLVGDS